jgi:hypothetical protein
MNTLIKNLRNQGYKIYVTHFRYVFDKYGPRGAEYKLKPLPEIRKENSQHLINTKGGLTIAKIELDGEEKASATSVCSMDDDFVKKSGVNRALGKAVHFLKNS